MGERGLGKRTLALFAIAAILASCTGNQTSPSAAPSSSGPSDSPENNTLRVAIPTDIQESDNLQARSMGDRIVVGSTVYEPLFGSDRDGQLQPALATDAVASQGGLVWTLTLQDGVTFQNGKEFTADDVKANLEAFIDPDNASNLAGDIPEIASIAVTGPLEVEFTLAEPSSAFADALTDNFFMVDTEARATMGADDWTAHPVGTGPYQMVSRTVGDNITFERYDDYWRGTPPLDGVIFRVIPDPQVAILALQAGEIDIVPNNVPSETLDDLRADPSLQILEQVGSSIGGIAYPNFEKDRQGGYADGDAFRLGLAHLINAQEQVPPIIGEFGTYSPQPLPPWMPGYDESIEPFEYDPDLGVELLTQGGFPPGSTIKTIVNVSPYVCDWATAIGSTLEELGYTVDQTCGDANDEEIIKYEWDLMFTRAGGRPTPAVFFNDRWRISLAEAKDDYWTLMSPELQTVIDELLAEFDPERVDELAKQASNMIVKEEVAMYGGFMSITRWAASTRVQGLNVTPYGYNGFLYNDWSTVSLGS